MVQGCKTLRQVHCRDFDKGSTMPARENLSHYSKKMRGAEISSILAFISIFIGVAKQLDRPQFLEWFVPVIAALVAADIVSGFVHWFADTWGSADWPILGSTLIRSFREHHVDQASITRHDFIETNGATGMVTLPVLASGLFFPSNSGKILILSFCLFIFLTNQIHKWAHQEKNSAVVTLLQRFHLILSSEKHKLHHCGDHKFNYAITTGWTNVFLDRFKVFRVSEHLFSFLTGLHPRAEDALLIQRFRRE
jgi:plasmanylethanolamine desaturase